MKLPVNYNDTHFTKRRPVREEYVKRQGGRCYHCNTSLDGEPSKKVKTLLIDKDLFPSTMFNWPVHLHHNRNTGMTIGAVHAVCNAVLWQYYGE